MVLDLTEEEVLILCRHLAPPNCLSHQFAIPDQDRRIIREDGLFGLSGFVRNL